jgi:hypothetical protein
VEVLDMLQLPELHEGAEVCAGRWDCPRVVVASVRTP